MCAFPLSNIEKLRTGIDLGKTLPSEEQTKPGGGDGPGRQGSGREVEEKRG